MKIRLLGLLLLFPFCGWTQLQYPSYSELTSDIRRIAPPESLGKSYGGEEIPVIKIQASARPKPTLLLVAGIDGRHPAGTLSAVQLAKNILALPKDSLNALLANNSIWIVPMLNPDAYKRNIASTMWNAGNARAIDNDRDGRLDEDAPEDLNKDGVIAQMRVRSIAGTYLPHKDYADYLISADVTKGEKGIFERYTEGRDLDRDGLFAEDGLGGVNIDKNFTFDYPAFTEESGDYAASEPETRALVDFIFGNPQIAVLLHFGLHNNLSVAEKFDARQAADRIIGSWSENDVAVSNYVSHLYNKANGGLQAAPKMAGQGGNFTNTGYYHLGKYSFSTPVWWPSLQDSTGKARALTSKDDEVRFIEWASVNKVPGALLPWVKINHPDFPDQEVEVGGVVPVYRNNPPIRFLEPSALLHASFVAQLLSSLAKLEFQQPSVTPLGDDIFRVELRVVNTGLMPTYPEIADKIKHVSKMKAVCTLQKGQQFLSGKRLELFPALRAGQGQTYSWLIRGKGSVEITAGCPTAGEKTIKVTL